VTRKSRVALEKLETEGIGKLMEWRGCLKLDFIRVARQGIRRALALACLAAVGSTVGFHTVRPALRESRRSHGIPEVCSNSTNTSVRVWVIDVFETIKLHFAWNFATTRPLPANAPFVEWLEDLKRQTGPHEDRRGWQGSRWQLRRRRAGGRRRNGAED